MSNITIAESEAELAAFPQDILLTRLAKFTKDGAFTGKYAGPDITKWRPVIRLQTSLAAR